MRPSSNLLISSPDFFLFLNKAFYIGANVRLCLIIYWLRRNRFVVEGVDMKNMHSASFCEYLHEIL